MTAPLPEAAAALRLPRPLYHQIVDQLRQAYPLEACGILAGRLERVSRVYPVENLLASPVAYEMEPQQQVAAMLDIEARGLDMVAIYHSHPQGPQVPSATDVARAYYPEALHLIFSLADRERPVVRAFAIDAGRVEERPLTLE